MIWLPDVGKILLIAKRGDSSSQIWTVDYSDGKTQKVTNDLADYRDLSLTSDNSKLVTRQSKLTSNILIIPDANISKAYRINKDTKNHPGIFSLRWVDNKRVIYEKLETLERELWISGLKMDSATRLTKQRQRNFSNPIVSKNADTIYFGSNEGAQENIWRVKSDGTDLKRLISDKEYQISQPALSPDEKFIYFLKTNKKSTSIWRRFLETGETEKILEPKDFTIGNFVSVSPDGKYLAFQYIRRGKTNSKTLSNPNTEIGFFKLADKTTKSIKIQTNRQVIRWTNNGKTFDYRRNTKEGGKILRQNLTDLSEKPKVIFHLPKSYIYNFDWSPNGKDLAISHGNNRSNAVLLTINDQGRSF